MKTCPICRAAYSGSFSVCPQDASPLIDADDWSVGTVVSGRYRILAKLDEDRICSVFKAFQLQPGQFRTLAVAQRGCQGHALDPEKFWELFRQAAVDWMKVQHPNVAHIEVGEDDEGRPFIVMKEVMEWEGGRSLEKSIRQEALLPPLRASVIAKQIAAGLAAAHAVGCVHGGVAPKNIFLLPSPDGERTKLIPLGFQNLKEALAKYVDPEFDFLIDANIRYWSPEQIASRPLDGRTDLYSLGIIMYEMLTTDFPFKANTRSRCCLRT